MREASVSESELASRTEPAGAPIGLSDPEAAARRRDPGNNAALPTSRSYRQILGENGFTFINNALFGLGVALVAVGRVSDALVSVGVAMLNVAVSVAQEVRANKTLDRIALLTRPRASVIRDGRERQVAPEAVVQGDLPFVAPGAPFGSDRQPTLLGLALMAVAAAGALLAAALAFRREGLAGGLFLGCGALALAQDLSRLLSGNFYPQGFWTGVVVGIVPTLGVGALLLLAGRARRRASVLRPAPGGELERPLGAQRRTG